MSVFLLAKMKCNEYGCQSSVDIEVELKEGAQGIPELLWELPDGWKIDRRGDPNIHYCPEHK